MKKGKNRVGKWGLLVSVKLCSQFPSAIVNIKVIHWPSKTDPLALV